MFLSKNIVIQKMDGSAEIRENISHIITDLQNGGTCTWIPMDEVLNTDIGITYEMDAYKLTVSLQNADNIAY